MLGYLAMSCHFEEIESTQLSKLQQLKHTLDLPTPIPQDAGSSPPGVLHETVAIL